MISINRLQVGNLLEHKGVFKQITQCMPNLNKVFLQGVDYAVNACDINEIEISKELYYIALSIIPDNYNRLKVIDYIENHTIQYI